ncbi:unnamed protein product, partial [Mesorhabditis belari]|uniref:Major facilitator superfamily (MFS) profile domain-containing protein n=1 Tax=Mesorhabditis belari TaxID=2138241 RepID=A0A915H1Q5_9BILA
MDFIPSWPLGLRVVTQCLFGAYSTYLILAFSTLSDPLEKLYNESIYSHYGVILGKQQFAYIVGMISAAKLIGSICSLMVLYPLLDSLGRKKMAVHFPFILGGLIGSSCQILAKLLVSVELFFIGELFIGAAFPLMNFATIMYLSECAPNRIRGATTLLLGITGITSWIGMSILAKPHVLGNADRWHFIPIIAAVMALIHFSICILFPESPKFLYYRGKTEEAARAVQIFHGNDVNVAEVLEEYSREVHHPLDEQVTLWKVWEDTEYREALFIVLLFDLASQLSPNNIDVNYHVMIRKKLGYTVDEIMLQRILVSAIIFPLNFFAAYAIERFGRRFLTVYCFVVTLIQVFWLAFGQFLYDNHQIGLLSRVTGTLTNIAGNLLSNSGFANMTFLMMAELCVPSIRTTVAQAAALLAMIAQMFIFSTYPPLVASIGAWYYLLTTTFMIIIFIMILHRLPETKRLPVIDIIDNLEEIVRSRANTLVIPRSRAHSEREPLMARRRHTYTGNHL